MHPRNHETASGTEGAKLLLVDDKPENLAALEAMLAELGYPMVTANSGREALRLLMLDEFALVLLDVRMPDLTGPEVAAMMREREQTRLTPIIFLTAQDLTNESIARGYESGGVDYLFKPLNPHILRAKVRIFVQLAQARQQLEEENAERRRAEAALEELNSELEHRVSARTAELQGANAALSESEERLRLAAQATGFATYDFDPRRRRSVWSEQILTLLGLPETAAVKDEEFRRLVHPEDREAFARALEQELDPARQDRHEFEFRILRSDGETRWLRDTGRTFFEVEQGASRAIRILGTVQDITARKQAEEALRCAHDELEQRVSERTAELACANGKLQAEMAERGQLQQAIASIGERERQRIGHDLHDGLCQLLTGVRCKTEALVERLMDRSPIEARNARSIVRLLTQAMDEARCLAHGLEPVEPLPEGLEVALQRLAQSTRELFGMACQFEITRPVPVPDHTIATDLFRIAQEAVNNAVKHSEATTLHLSLARSHARVVLMVCCNGKPFPARPNSSGMGLKTMSYRASRIGAKLTFHAGPQGGAIVRCSVPIPEYCGEAPVQPPRRHEPVLETQESSRRPRRGPAGEKPTFAADALQSESEDRNANDHGET